MGFFGNLFGWIIPKVRDADQYLEEAARFEAEEEAAEARAEEALPSERSLINQIQLAYDKKSKLVWAQNKYVGGVHSVVGRFTGFINAIKVFNTAIGQIKPGLGVAAAGLKGFSEGDTGAAQKAGAELARMVASVMQIQKQLEITREKQRPVYDTSLRLGQAIKEQRQLLAQYEKVLKKELTDVADEADKAQKVIVDLEEGERKLSELAKKAA